MKRLLVVTVLLATACARPAAPSASAPPLLSPKVATADLPRPPDDAVRAKVVRVVDGDTIVLSGIDVGEIDRSTGGRKARIIGIDTPEVFGTRECFGDQASAFTKRELDGASVLIDFDVELRDRYGRALVYVWEVDGTFFNARQLSEGYASQATFPPNVRYVELFTRLARAARENDRGLWKACS